MSHRFITSKKRDVLLWFPVAVIFTAIPLICRYKLYESRLSEFLWTPFETTAVDFDLYYKQIVFEIFAGMIFLFFCFLMWENNIWKNQRINPQRPKPLMQFLPLGVYVLFAMLSSLFSEYKYAAFTGSDGQFQSFFALAGYALFAAYMSVLLQEEQDIRRFLACVLAGSIVPALYGLLEFSGNRPVAWEWVQRLITPVGYLETVGPVESTFEDWRVSLFSYNPNYAGVLLALLAAFCFGMLLTETNRRRLAIEILLFAALLTALVGTGSKAGLLTFTAVAAVGLLFIRKRFKKYWKIVFPAITAVCLVAAAGSILFLSQKGLQIWTQLKQVLTIEKSEPNPLQEMLTEEDKVCFSYRDIFFSVAFDYEDDTFYFNVLEYPSKSDAENDTGSGAKELTLVLSEDRTLYYIDREGLSDVSIRPGIINGAVPAFAIYLNGREWMFVKLDELGHQYYYLNGYLKLEELVEIKRFGFEGYEHFATDRGLIWSMTLPLLADSLVLGSGADTFAFVYPQNNYKDLYYYTGAVTASTRPHSLYLQAAVECGVPALLALLVFWGWYLIQSLKLYWKGSFETLAERAGLACFLAVTVYVVCGLTNDSMITVAPVFWGICGAGVGLNRMAAIKRNGK